MVRLKEGEVRIPSGCAIAGILNQKGTCFSGDRIISCIASMRQRSNGLGGGFAAYGIYPQYEKQYALHLYYDHEKARSESETLLNRNFKICSAGMALFCRPAGRAAAGAGNGRGRIYGRNGYAD